GAVIAESVKVKLQDAWPDYVFDESYTPSSLAELETFIKINKHLPDMPPAKEVKEEGIDLGEMNAKLLEKIEELTLYIIQQDKDVREKDKLIEKLSLSIIEHNERIAELESSK